MADLKVLRRQSAEMTGDLLSVLEIPFEETTELQRQLLAAFSFGMLFVIGQINKLTAPEIHALTICLLLDVFKCSDHQAVALAQDILSGRGNPTTDAVIHRGIDGHRQWEAGLMSELKSNIEEIFEIVQA